MFDTLNVILATLALAISVVTAWLTLFRRGQVRMTRPTMLALNHESVKDVGRVPKIVARALLYSTADRGAVIESMYAVIRQKERSQNFAFWGYGEDTQLVRGGGMYVGRQGVAVYHHLVSLDRTPFGLTAGSATVEIYATVLGAKSPQKLSESTLTLTEEVVDLLNSKRGEVMFNLDPQSGEYVSEHRDLFPIVPITPSRRRIVIAEEASPVT